MTWQQVLLEWQRDWAKRDSYDAVMDIVREHSGAYGMGVDYAYTAWYIKHHNVHKVSTKLLRQFLQNNNSKLLLKSVKGM